MFIRTFDAAPPLIIALTKMPKSRFAPVSDGFVLPLTLTPKPAELVSFKAMSKVRYSWFEASGVGEISPWSTKIAGDVEDGREEDFFSS